MEHNIIRLSTLTMDELAGVVTLYPWYGAARKELCRRMAVTGGDSWGLSQYSDQAMYVGNRGAVAEIMSQSCVEDYSDKDLEALLKSYIEEKDVADSPKKEERKVHVIGGDFFSQAEYEKVRRQDDNVFSRASERKKASVESEAADPQLDFCTETLAAIYADQGYFDQAKRIYNKLILAIPEKSAYFASLIEKLDKLINNQTL